MEDSGLRRVVDWLEGEIGFYSRRSDELISECTSKQSMHFVDFVGYAAECAEKANSYCCVLNKILEEYPHLKR